MTEIDSNHRGPIVNLATWITLVSVIIFATSKIVTKWILARRLHGDDAFVLIATVCPDTHEQIQVSKHCTSNALIVFRGRLLRRHFSASAVGLRSAHKRFERTAIG